MEYENKNTILMHQMDRNYLIRHKKINMFLSRFFLIPLKRMYQSKFQKFLTEHVQQPVGAPEIKEPTKKTKWQQLAAKLN